MMKPVINYRIPVKKNVKCCLCKVSFPRELMIVKNLTITVKNYYCEECNKKRRK